MTSQRPTFVPQTGHFIDMTPGSVANLLLHPWQVTWPATGTNTGESGLGISNTGSMVSEPADPCNPPSSELLFSLLDLLISFCHFRRRRKRSSTAKKHAENKNVFYAKSLNHTRKPQNRETEFYGMVGRTLSMENRHENSLKIIGFE